jgi:hypothetical protein
VKLVLKSNFTPGDKDASANRRLPVPNSFIFGGDLQATPCQEAIPTSRKKGEKWGHLHDMQSSLGISTESSHTYVESRSASKERM